MAGLTNDGFVAKRVAEIRADLNQALKDQFGDDIQLGPDSIFGQIRDTFAAELGIVWEAALALYDSFDIDHAKGAQLDNLVALRGQTRQGAEFSTSKVTFSGTNGTIIEKGFTVKSPDTNTEYTTDREAEIGHSNSSKDATDVPVIAKEAGPITEKEYDASVASKDSQGIRVLVDTKSGVDSITHANAITESKGNVGRNRETDSELRNRSNQAISEIGAGTAPAIEAELLDVQGLDFAAVLNNRSYQYDTSRDMSPSSFKAVILPDHTDADLDENDVFNAIYRTMPAGIRPEGSRAAEVEDITNQTHTVRYTSATKIDIILQVNIETTNDWEGSDSKKEVRNILENYINSLSPGQDFNTWISQSILLQVDGINDCQIKSKPSGGTLNEQNVVIGHFEVANLADKTNDITFDTSYTSTDL